MTTSAETIRRWKAELEINERLLKTGSKRFRWLRSLYVRVYQFLLSRYDDEGLPARTQVTDSGPDDDDHASAMPFVDLTSDHRGLQARSPQSLRYVLEQVHSNQPAPVSADTSDHNWSRTAEWVVVATSQDYRLSSCEIVLKDRGIKFRRSACRFYQGLEVRFEDRNVAFAVLRVHPQYALRWTERDRVDARHSRETRLFLLRIWTLLIGILIAILLAFFIVVGTQGWP